VPIAHETAGAARTRSSLRPPWARASVKPRAHRAARSRRYVGEQSGRFAPRNDGDYSGAALLACELESFEASEAITITTAISAITMVQIALISGFTPSRTSE